MGWQDAPAVDEQTPAWQAAPAVDQKRSFGDMLYENVIGRGEVDTFGERLGEYVKGGAAAMVRGFGDAGAFVTGGPAGMFETKTPVGTVPSVGSMMRQVLGDISGGHTDYKAPGRTGDFISTAGEFAGSGSLLGGLPMLGPSTISGLGSEAGGQLTEGTKYEPAARLAGGVLAYPFYKWTENLARRAITPHPAKPYVTQAADAMDDAGVSLTAGQRTGSATLQNREGLTQTGRNLLEQSGDDFTTAVMARIRPSGATYTPDTRASSEAMTRAYKNIGAMFDDVATRNNIVVDQTLIDDVDDVLRAYMRDTASASVVPGVGQAVDDVFNWARAGSISGTQYQSLSSRLSQSLKNAKDTTLGAYVDIKGALDAAMQRSAQAAGNMDDVAKLVEARYLYRDFLAVEVAASRVGSTTGNISPANLASGVKMIFGRRNYVLGRAEIAELSKQGSVAFARPYGTEAIVRNQQTADLVKSIFTSGGAGGAIGTALGGPVGGAVGGATGMLTGSAMPYAYNRYVASSLGQAHMGNQLLTEASKMDAKHFAGIIAALMANKAATGQTSPQFGPR